MLFDTGDEHECSRYPIDIAGASEAIAPDRAGRRAVFGSIRAAHLIAALRQRHVVTHAARDGRPLGGEDQ